MASVRISRKAKNNFKNKIRSFVDKLSTPVQVYKAPIKSECPNCYFDSLTNKSTHVCKWTLAESYDKQSEYESSGGVGLRYKFFTRGRCPICRGKGYLESQRVLRVNCKVVWNPSTANLDNGMSFTPIGYEGATVAELKAHPKYFESFRDCVKIIIDGISCKLSAPPVTRGIGNDSIMVVRVFTDDKPKSNSGEVFKNY